MEINKVQWRIIAKGAKLPCDSFLMKKDGTITSMVTGAGVEIGQDAYYLPVEELRSFPKEESKDERIRKYLKHIIGKWSYDDLFAKGFRKEDIIAWLEKQGEQILANSAKTCKDEQKPEVDQHSLPVSDDSSLPTFDESIYHPCTEKVYEQKPWSEEDEYHKRQILRILKDNGCSQTLQERTEKWIEERLKSLRPQNKTYYWTENEIKFAISDYIRGAESYEKMVEKLRCLKPQSQWKPSDEQMTYIQDAISKYNEFSNEYTGLVKLYNDLKKLKGE